MNANKEKLNNDEDDGDEGSTTCIGRMNTNIGKLNNDEDDGDEGRRIIKGRKSGKAARGH
jgi:hypothetical protein